MKSLKFPALLVAAALYACPVWVMAQGQRSPSGTGSSAGSSARDAAGAAGANTANDTRARTASAREGAAAAGAHGQMSEDQAFVRDAASAGMMEVQAGKLALQKAQRPEVKEFAQKLVDDHTKANQRLMQIAQSKQIMVPRQMKAGDRGQLQDLQELSGQQFDDAFMAGQVGDHVKTILVFRNCSQKLQDPELKQFAEQQLPALQQHLKNAEQLAGWDAAETAGAHIRGSSDATSAQQQHEQGTTPAAGERNTAGSRSGSATGERSGTGNTAGNTGTTDRNNPAERDNSK